MKAQKITAIVAGLFFASSAFAVPALQVDIGGGTYDSTHEDVVTSADAFDVYALATASGQLSETMILADEFFLAIAITPRPDSDTAFDFGSFSVNGTDYDNTDLIYGTPPTTALNDLGSHSIYDTWYLELAFTFSSSDESATYNVEDNPGGAQTTGTGSYYNDWAIDVTGMDSPYELHFDVYHTSVKTKGKTIGDYLDFFAPFSHDASTVPGDCCTTTKVPTPATLLLLGLGLAGMGAARRKQA